MALIKNVETSVEDIPGVGTGVGFCVNNNIKNILFLAHTNGREVLVSIGDGIKNVETGVLTKTASELMAEIKKYFEAVKAGNK